MLLRSPGLYELIWVALDTLEAVLCVHKTQNYQNAVNCARAYRERLAKKHSFAHGCKVWLRHCEDAQIVEKMFLQSQRPIFPYLTIPALSLRTSYTPSSPRCASELQTGAAVSPTYSRLLWRKFLSYCTIILALKR